MREHPGMTPGTRGKQAMNKIAAAMATGAATFALISVVYIKKGIRDDAHSFDRGTNH
jgi:hypothetical protein